MNLQIRLALIATLLFGPGLFGAGPATADYKLVGGPHSADPMAVHTYRLDNGLMVFLTENHEEPRFYAEIAVRAGSKNDPAESTGIAHYLEHMLFKGTDEIGTLDFVAEKVHLDSVEALYEQHWSSRDSTERAELYRLIQEQNRLAAEYAVPAEIKKVYASMGAESLNAGTWYEQTAYQVSLPSNRLEQWAQLETERFSNPVFRLFQTELETVYEEKNRSLDNKDRLISEAVRSMLWKVHPYGQRTTLGSVEHLKNPSLRRMYEFFETWYVPNNMAIILSGDIDIEATIGLIDTHFSSWVAKDLPDLPRWKEPKLDGRESIEVTYPGEEIVRIAFRTQPSTHKDTEALLVLDMILDNSTAGLINLNLNQSQAIRRAGATATSYNVSNDDGAQYLWGIPKADQSLEEVENLLLEQLEIIKRGEFDDWLIPAIVTDFKKTTKRQLETNTSRVRLIRDAFLSGTEWKKARRSLERMEKLRKKDIVRVARRYFGDDYVVGYRRDGSPVLPSIENPGIEPIQIDPSRQTPFAAGILAQPVESIEPEFVIPGRDYTQDDLRPGVELYQTKNPLNDLFTLRVVIDAGSRWDNRLPLTRDLMDKSGTMRMPSEGLKAEWYRLGSEFAINVSEHTTVFQLSGLDENFGPSVALMMEALAQPSASDSIMANLVGITLANRADALKDHRAIQRAMYRYARHGEKSYYLQMPSNEQVKALTFGELHELIGTLLGFEHRLEYTGTLSRQELVGQLASNYRLPQTDLQVPPAFESIEIRHPERTEILLFEQEMAQALVRIESGDQRYAEAIRPQIDLFNEYFYGGGAGIVFQEMRESRALAYQAWAWYFTGGRQDDPNLFAAFIGCQADKTPEAIAAFLELIDQMPVSPERLVQAKEAQISSIRTNRLGFRDLLGAVRMWEHQGVSIDPRSWRFDMIRMMDLDRLMEFHGEHIGGRPRLVTIVGQLSPDAAASLEQFGTLRRVETGDLFAF
ncbi:MAG: insulinase family protein [Gemmatimonadetes bacterium]|jgi:predicted Zn-dependent peptidase|nr:insulinase family protein [Gemmatimonadota bacterium]MBT7860357.1 insulinase family protein [Gemmatimonadota bacterium]